MLRPAFAVAFVAGLAVAGSAAAQIVTAAPTYFEARGKLTAAEMKAIFSGAYHEDGTDVKGHDWTVDAAADGSLKVAAGAYTDTGHARLDGVKLCVTYKRAWHGEERCYRYAHHGNELASYGPEGLLDSVVTVTR